MANSLAHAAPTKSLDAIDRKILATLQADGRISLAELAAKVGLSPSPCLRRMRLLEESGIIARYVAVIDQGKVVFNYGGYFIYRQARKPARGGAQPLHQGDRALAGSAGMLPDDRPARLSAARRGRRSRRL